jgi:hypothetical protein
VCTPCSSCVLGTFQTVECKLKQDTTCEECPPCADGTFKVGECSDNAETECEVCNPCKDAGFYVKTRCNATHDTECLRCPVGSYCLAGETVPRKCPEYQTSLLGARALADCRCMRGFEEF